MTTFLFSILSYLTGMSSLIYYFWMIEFGDHFAANFTLGKALFNTVLFLLFPLQHSILARDFVKKKMSPYLHRSFYVFTSGIALWIVLLLWQPGGPFLYQNVAPWLFNTLFYVSVALIILSTMALSHAQMFGLFQGYAAWKRRPLPDSKLQTDGIYGIVRHPITSLLLIALWSHESMTAGRVLFNALFSVYAVLGTLFEERSLVRELGQEYLEYRKKVPAFVPRF
jgi:protein-S-isoprenylcysteine O-methyltransferase Ste14